MLVFVLGKTAQILTLLTEVEHEVANSHKYNRSRCSLLLVNAVVDAAGYDKEESKDEERAREPQASRDAVSKEDKASTASDRCERNCE
jgi:hypothetical protein